ncbi:hypothetical protein ACIA8H_06130 [Streptomyces goshikiensis]
MPLRQQEFAEDTRLRAVAGAEGAKEEPALGNGPGADRGWRTLGP